MFILDNNALKKNINANDLASDVPLLGKGGIRSTDLVSALFAPDLFFLLICNRWKRPIAC